MTPLRHVPCAECRSAHYHCVACDPHSACAHSLMAVRLGLPPERFPALETPDFMVLSPGQVRWLRAWLATQEGPDAAV